MNPSSQETGNTAGADSPDGSESYRRSDLWHRADYRWWFAGDSSVDFGDGIRAFALPLIAFALTGRTAASGALATAMSATSLVTSLIGGSVIDAIDRRAGIHLRCATGILIWTCAVVLLATGNMGFAALVCIGVLSSLTTGLFGYASDAALKSLVPTQAYPQASSNNEGRSAAVSLMSGPLSGALYSIATWIPCAVPVAAFAVGSLSASRIKADLRPDAFSDTVASTRRGPAEFVRTVADGLVEGIRWMIARKRLLSIQLCFCVFNLGFSSAFYAVNYHLISAGEQPWRIGLISTATAVATLIGAIVGPTLINRIPTGILDIALLAWIAACVAPLALTQSLVSALVCLGLAFVANPILNSGIFSYALSQVPTDHQARVTTVMNFVSSAMTMISPVLVGLALERWTAGPIIAVAVCAMLIALVIALANPLLREIPTPEQWDQCAL
ncbi:MFS transporter [Schaalia naturae]|uniref:MFS transporter n=1 Tax=Schaalia naturae TaxID=635203 RepID=A0ABW2SJI2_9ACTO